jgi:hypothetical protein
MHLQLSGQTFSIQFKLKIDWVNLLKFGAQICSQTVHQIDVSKKS